MELPEEVVSLIYEFARPVQSPYKIRWSWVMLELQYRHFCQVVLIVKLLDLPISDVCMYYSPILIDFMKTANKFEENAGEPWTKFINIAHKSAWDNDFVCIEMDPFTKLSPNMTAELFVKKIFNKYPTKPLKALMPLKHMEHLEEYGTEKEFLSFWKGYIRQRLLGNINAQED